MAASRMKETTWIDPRLAKDVIQISISLFKHSNVKIREKMFSNIREIIVRHLKTETQFTTDVVKKSLFPLFQNSDNEFKFSTLSSIIALISLSQDYDIHFLRDLTKQIIPLLKDSDNEKKRAVSESFEKLIRMSKNWDTQLIRDIIKALTPILYDPNSNPMVKIDVSYDITTILDLDINSDVKFRKEVLNSLIHVLQNSSHDLKKQIMNRIARIIKNCPSLCKDAVNILTPLLQDPDPEIRTKTIEHLLEFIKIDPTLLRDVFNLLAQALQNSSQEVRKSISMYLVALVERAENTDPQLSRDVFKLLSSFGFQESENNDAKATALSYFADLAKLNSGDIQFGKDIISLLTPFLQDKTDSIRQSAAYSIAKTTKLVFHKDFEFIKRIIELLIPLTKDSSWVIRKSVGSYRIPKLVELLDKTDTQLIQNSFEIVLSFLQESEKEIREGVPEQIAQFVQKIDTQLSRKAIEALIPLLKDPDQKAREETLESIVKLVKLNKDFSHETAFLKEIISSLTLLLNDFGESGNGRGRISLGILCMKEIANFSSDTQLAKDTIKTLTPLFKNPNPAVAESVVTSITELCANRDIQFLKEIIDNYLTSVFKDSDQNVRQLVSRAITGIIKQKDELLHKDVLSKTLTPLLKDSEGGVRRSTLQNLTFLLKTNDGKYTDIPLVKYVIENYIPLLQDSDNLISQSTTTSIKDLLAMKDDDQLVKDTISILSPFFQHSNSDVAKNALEILKSVYHKLLLNPDIFGQYLTHSSKNLRDTVVSFLIGCLEKYLNDFQGLDQLFQCPLSDLTVDIILKKLFKESNPSGDLQENLQKNLDQLQEEQLKLLLVSEINKIKTLKGPGIIGLSFAIIGQEKTSKDGSDHQKLIELAKEVLANQLKYLNEEGLIWINKHCEKLLSLSPEAKIFYKKVYHKLLEDEEITSLEEELLIKFINQGLTTSLTRDGQIIFEGKRYKLKGDNIELALEKIAKTVIDQQQDVLALQYKQHEPIFKISHMKGGMKQAASDIKEIKSIVDSRHTLKIGSWIMTRLKSLKFNSEIFLLEQRSAFGDHVIYHLGHQKLIRFYPSDTPVFQEIFGSYIYGEAYQGEVTELADKVGEKLLDEKEKKPSKIHIEGKLKSKQIYFQQELLKQGNEDRNSAVEEDLAKKLDNNRAILESKLKSLKLQDFERPIIEGYYEGFVSTFSSVFTSSQAVASGKLSIDDGEDFFSPVNIFIQLTSLAPFGIGEILSGGLEAVRSHLKSTSIANEAKFVKDIAIDAVDLSDLVSKIALNIISNKEKRKEILEAKDDEEQTNLINKVKNLVMEKIEKLKNLAEKYTKMKNLFEKEVETSPAFRLGESDANKIIKEWIDLKGQQPDLRMKPEEKQKKFVKVIIGELGEGNKITPMPTSPQEVKPQARGKTACCEIF